jgi:hypothetical protein
LPEHTFLPEFPLHRPLVACQLDANAYQKCLKVSDAELARLNIKPAAFHSEWNCTIAPARPEWMMPLSRLRHLPQISKEVPRIDAPISRCRMSKTWINAFKIALLAATKRQARRRPCGQLTRAGIKHAEQLTRSSEQGSWIGAIATGRMRESYRCIIDDRTLSVRQVVVR